MLEGSFHLRFEPEVSNLGFHIAFLLASNSLHYLYSVIVRSNLYQFFLPYSKLLCCLNICAALLRRFRLFYYQENVDLIFSYVLKHLCTKQVSQMNMRYLSHEGHSSK